MSEREPGPAERAALERARVGELARRREGYTRLEQVAELDRSAVAEVTGDRSTERLLEELWRISAAEARRLVAESRDLCPRRSLLGEALAPRLPCTATVAASGEIGPAHIAIIRTTMRRLDRVEGLPAPAWADAEQTLADEATRWGPRGLQAVADRLLAHLDPDGDEPPEEARSRDDELLFSHRRDGTLLFRGRMGDPVDGEAFLEVIDGLATRCGPEDQRELARRRVDGLKDLVADARSPRGIATDTTGPEGRPEDQSEAPSASIPEPRRGHPAGGAPRVERPGRALLTITIDHRWLREALGERGGFGLLDSGARVHPATARRWACDAAVIPVVLGSRSEPLDVGRAQRTAGDAIRRALDLRDGGCAFPGCDRRPRRCQAHHVDHWLDGGETALDNMCLLCSFHHQLVHHGHWTIRMIDGRPWFTPPWIIDPGRRPRPGGRPRVPT
ncbi:HNH endonuclease signature motif containing protein [Actinomycetospora lemnae]|uniref:DUF222 domain-containing protein n=1 Tax=Actinomycetospora lemnae TaxID=3019891 RepID=A0ABT5SQ14_9PSEU|nr:HNH endonuclease signature motif containing protein [Actinomycetospora sp. DW7H6]MDD7964933.1 DUF222 domain-containing protein [Actinomycetospora sp. DW7H6]